MYKRGSGFSKRQAAQDRGFLTPVFLSGTQDNNENEHKERPIKLLVGIPESTSFPLCGNRAEGGRIHRTL